MMEFLPFRLDPFNRRLWRSDRGTDAPVDLPPRAVDLLCLLAENSQRLVTHEEILKALWRGLRVQPEVIKNQVLLARQALGDSQATPRYIETVRGRGYRFIARVTQVVPPAPPTPGRDHSLVGRGRALSMLRESLEGAVAGSTQMVFISGEMGIGKTALIETFLHSDAPAADFMTGRGQCIEGFGGTEPYYPLLDCLGRLCKGPFGRDVRKSLLSHAPSWAIQMPAMFPLDVRQSLLPEAGLPIRDRMLREICELFNLLSQNQTLVLVFEDLQWADYSSIDFLSAIVQSQPTSRLLILLSYRPEDAASTEHPVKSLSHHLVLRNLCREIRLAPLSESSILEFLTLDAPQAPAPVALARLLQQRSEGNPLFMRAVLDDLTERGAIEAGRPWALNAPLAELSADVPQTLSEVIEARIQRLSEDDQRALQAAAIAGMTFATAVVAETAGLSAQRFEDLCEALCRQQSFIEHSTRVHASPEDRGYAFRHVAYRHVFYGRQGVVRRAEGHRWIGARLESLLSAEQKVEFAATLALHFKMAHEWVRAVDYMLMALNTAQRRSAIHEALDIIDQTLMLLNRLPQEASAPRRLQLLESRAGILTIGHDERAARAHEEIIAAGAAANDLDLQVRGLLGLAYVTGWTDLASSVRLLDQALELSERQTDGALRDRCQVSAFAWRIWIRGWHEEDAQQCEAIYRRLQGRGDALRQAWAATEYSVICFLSSRYQEALDVAVAGYQVLHGSNARRPEYSLERALWTYSVGTPLVLMYLGQLGAALVASDEGIERFTQNGNTFAVTALRIYRAYLLVECLDLEGALAICNELGVSLGSAPSTAKSQTLPPAEHRLCLLVAARAHAGLGRHALAEQCLLAAQQCMQEQPVIVDWYWRMPLEWCRIEVLLARGASQEAQAYAARLLAHAGQTEERTWQALAWEANARVALSAGVKKDAIQGIEHALEMIEGYKTPLASRRVHATATRIFHACDDAQRAERHAGLCAAVTQDIELSLPEEHPLRSRWRKETEALSRRDIFS